MPEKLIKWNVRRIPIKGCTSCPNTAFDEHKKPYCTDGVMQIHKNKSCPVVSIHCKIKKRGVIEVTHCRECPYRETYDTQKDGWVRTVDFINSQSQDHDYSIEQGQCQKTGKELLWSTADYVPEECPLEKTDHELQMNLYVEKP